MLFLNKCDILDAKLRSGIKLADYVTSYGERPNVFEEASQCAYQSFLFCVLWERVVLGMSSDWDELPVALRLFYASRSFGLFALLLRSMLMVASVSER